jgi:hypothetical protein
VVGLDRKAIVEMNHPGLPSFRELTETKESLYLDKP